MFSPNPYNLIVEVLPAKQGRLKEILTLIQEDLYENEILRFPEIESIHFGRFVLIDGDTEEHPQKYSTYLAFATNYDGSLEEHLAEIIQKGREGLDLIFSCCKGYPAAAAIDDDKRLEFLKKYAQYKSYYYRGTWGRTVRQIKTEERCRSLAENCLDELGGLSTDQLCENLIQDVQNRQEWAEFPDIDTPRLKLWASIKLVMVLLLVLILLIPFLLILLLHEIFDKAIEPKISSQSQTKILVAQEDFIVQNQLTHLVEVRPGWFRRFSVKMVLGGIAWMARYHYNKGKLGGIPSIHFARWILIDGGRRLLFFSNFDGSWESYLGDFVDRAAIGLTGVWSNTKGFPLTRLLVFKGARDALRFKAWTRAHQVFTDVWYSAYPNLTVQNIKINTEIYQGLQNQLVGQERETWLSKF